MNKHICIDLETLSTNTDAQILSIGAVKFDVNNKHLTKTKENTFYVRIDIDSCKDLNLSIEENTLAWWSKQSKEAQDEAFNEQNRINIRTALIQLSAFCVGSQYFWSNGSSFDIVILETIYKKLKIAIPWKYWQVRDCRTLFDLGVSFNRPTTIQHHALDDAFGQSTAIIDICQQLAKFGINSFPDK